MGKRIQKRGLSHNKNTPEALGVRVGARALELYERMGVLSKLESKARHDIEITHYISRIQIESRVLGDVARNHVVPTAIKYQNILIDNVRGIKEIYGSNFMNFLLRNS